MATGSFREDFNRDAVAQIDMYGDLQGIAGRALQEIEVLQHTLLEGGTGENDD